MNAHWLTPVSIQSTYTYNMSKNARFIDTLAEPVDPIDTSDRQVE